MTQQPNTTAIPTGWRHRLDPRPSLIRVRDSGIAIVQIVVAATGAYAFAAFVLGHPAPLLAATVTVSSLGLVRDARPRRVLETVIGRTVKFPDASVSGMPITEFAPEHAAAQAYLRLARELVARGAVA